MYCGAENCHMTYSGVHIFRANIIKATIKYIEENRTEILENYEEDEYMVETFNECYNYLKSLLNENVDENNLFSERINYDNFNMTESNKLKLFGLYGIIPVVYHSDCDGSLTYGEAYDFMQVLKKIFIFIDKSDFDDEIVKLRRYHMYKVFNECIKTKENIIFG